MWQPLDILNEAGEKTGEAKMWEEVHEKGLLHRSVHVWLLNSKGELLVQKRSKHVKSPGVWDNSASGHVVAGQSSLEAAQMETKEELGLSLPESAFQYLFTANEYKVLDDGAFIERAFNDIYLVQIDRDISEFKLEPKEVEEVHWLSLEEFKKWVRGEGEPLCRHDEEFEKLIAYLETKK